MMNQKVSVFIFFTSFFLLIFVQISGCSGSIEGKSNDSFINSAPGVSIEKATKKTISGQVLIGSNLVGSVEAYEINNGLITDLLSITEIEGNGKFTVLLDRKIDNVFLKAEIISYVDDITGTAVTNLNKDTTNNIPKLVAEGIFYLEYILLNSTDKHVENISITPLTTIVSANVMALDQGITSENVQISYDRLSLSFGGLNIESTNLPTNVNIKTLSYEYPSDSIQYTLILAGIKRLAIEYGISYIQLTNLLANDFTDGVFDGNGIKTETQFPIVISTKLLLPSTAGSSDLAGSIEAFIQENQIQMSNSRLLENLLFSINSYIPTQDLEIPILNTEKKNNSQFGKLSWPPVLGSTSYNVYWSTDEISAAVMANYNTEYGSLSFIKLASNITGNEFQLPLLEKGIINSYFVTPVNMNGEGIRSNIVKLKNEVLISDIDIRDDFLRACIDNNGSIYTHQVKTITCIGDNLIERVSNLEGLENFKYLRELDVHSGITIFLGELNAHPPKAGITDVSPLSKLTRLTKLNMRVHYIDDISPLSSLTNLEYLDISNNDISNISGLDLLTKLKQLEITHNKINDLSLLNSLVNLERLAINYNDISDLSPLASLTKLEKLNIGKMGNGNLDFLINLLDLEIFELDASEVTNFEPIVNSNNLKELNLWFGNITDVSGFSNMTGLNKLTLSYTKIGTGLNELVKLKKLKLLDFRNSEELSCESLDILENSFDSEVFNRPYRCRPDAPVPISKIDIADLNLLDCIRAKKNIEYTYQLTSLSCKNYGITDLSGIDQLSYLYFLTIEDNDLSGVDLSLLKNIKTMKFLTLSGKLKNLAQIGSLTSLTNLRLIGSEITDISPLSNLVNLQYLYISAYDLTTNYISDVSPLALIPNLTSLYLIGNNITDITKISLLANLQKLDLSYNSITTGATNLSQLKKLSYLSLLKNNNIPCEDIDVLRIAFSGINDVRYPSLCN